MSAQAGYKMDVQVLTDPDRFDPSVSRFVALAFSVSGCDACHYLREAIEALPEEEFGDCRFFSHLVEPGGAGLAILEAYRPGEFPTLVIEITLLSL